MKIKIKQKKITVNENIIDENRSLTETEQSFNDSMIRSFSIPSSSSKLFRWILFNKTKFQIEIQTQFDSISDFQRQIKSIIYIVYNVHQFIIEYPVGQMLAPETQLNEINGGLKPNDPIIVRIPNIILKEQTGKTSSQKFHKKVYYLK